MNPADDQDASRSPIASTERPQLLQRARLQIDRVTGKPMLLYPEGVLFLNATGHAIITLCTKGYTFDEIITHLSGQFQVSPEQLIPEVTDYLNKLRAKNLLCLAPQSS